MIKPLLWLALLSCGDGAPSDGAPSDGAPSDGATIGGALGRAGSATPDALLSEMEELLSQGDLDGWRSLETRAALLVEEHPEDPQAWLTLARIYQNRDLMKLPTGAGIEQSERALAAYRTASELAPDDASIAQGLVEMLLYVGEQGEAIASAEALVARSDNATTRILLARALLDDDQFARAESELQSLLAAPGVSPRSQMLAKEYLGRLWLEQGRLEEAEAILKESGEALQRDASLKDSYYGCPFQALGELYTLTGQPEEAAANYAAAADLESVRADSQVIAALSALAARDLETYARYRDRAEVLSGLAFSTMLEQHPDCSAYVGDEVQLWDDVEVGGDDPNLVSALRFLASCSLLGEGQIERAEPALRARLKSPDLSPRSQALAREYLGRIWMEQGRLEEAEAILKESGEALQRDASLKDSHYGSPFEALGDLYTLSGRPEEAATYYDMAGGMGSVSAKSQATTALAALTAGDFMAYSRYRGQAEMLAGQPLSILLREDPECAAYIGDLIKRWHDVDARDADDPTIPGALRYLANLHFDAYSFGVAAEFAALVGETDPRARTLRGLVGLLQEDPGGAREHLAAAEPDGAAVIRGHLAVAEQDRAAAEAALGPIASRDAPSAGKVDALRYEQTLWRMANLGMAWAASNDDEHAAAIRHYDRALSVAPDDIFALLGKGNALAAMRLLDDAEALFERVLEAHPGNPYALAELGLVDYNRGDLAAAEARFQAALEADPTGYTCPHEGLGLVYLKQGKTDEAAAAFEQAIEINPEIEYKKFNGLAQIYIDQGRLDEARALLKQSIENYPHDDEAAQMLAELEGR